MGVWGAVAGSGGAAGVLLGGVLTEYAGWEWVLFVNVPIGLAAAVLAPRLLPESRNEGARRFDVAGAVTVTAGLSLLVYTLVDANDAGWISGQTLGPRRRRARAARRVRRRSSCAPRRRSCRSRIFRNRTMTGDEHRRRCSSRWRCSRCSSSSRSTCSRCSATTRSRPGLAYLPLAGGIIVSAGVASELVTRSASSRCSSAGLVLTAAGLVWFSQVSVGGAYVGDILFPSLLAAVGLGFAFVPMTIAAVAASRRTRPGLASGLINTSQQVGGALGLAILAVGRERARTTLMTDAGGAPRRCRTR